MPKSVLPKALYKGRQVSQRDSTGIIAFSLHASGPGLIPSTT